MFLDEAPAPLPLHITEDARPRSSVGDGHFGIGYPREHEDLGLTAPLPVVDVRTTTGPSTKNKVVVYNESFEFERSRQGGTVADELEQEQRDKEEIRLLQNVEESGMLAQTYLLSSPDPTTVRPRVDLDVIDADALLLLRIVDQDSNKVLAQSLIVVQNLRDVASPDDKDSVWATHALHSKTLGKNVGALRVGLRFRLSDSPDPLSGAVVKGRDESFYFESELMSDAIFSKYDTNSDGYLTQKEFLSFILELGNVGGNIKQLENADDGGQCLGACVPLPTMDLFSFIKHNHTLLVVCFDRTRQLRKHVSSSILGRLGLVVMSLLWSLSVNCLVVIYMQSSTRFWQILTILAVDNVGKSLLNGVFLVAHLRCWARLARKCTATHSHFTEKGGGWRSSRASMVTAGSSACELVSLLVFIIFLAFFSTWLLLTMTPSQLYSSGYSFLPIWCLSRFTEVFYWGA